MLLSCGSFLQLCATPCNEQITSKIAHLLATSVKALGAMGVFTPGGGGGGDLLGNLPRCVCRKVRERGLF